MDVSNSFQALCWNFLLLFFDFQKLWPDLPLFGISLSFECNCFYFLLLQVSHSALDLLENKPNLEGQGADFQNALNMWQPHNQTSKVKCKEQKGEGSLNSLIWWQCEGLLIQTLIVHIAEGCPARPQPLGAAAESWCSKTTETSHPSCPFVRVDEICCRDKLLVPFPCCGRIPEGGQPMERTQNWPPPNLWAELKVHQEMRPSQAVSPLHTVGNL